MKKYSWWILERYNPQLGMYYKGCGRMSKKAAKEYEGPIYGNNFMRPYETESDYNSALENLKNQGQTVLD